MGKSAVTVDGAAGRMQRHGKGAARVLTAVETVDMAAALVRERVARFRVRGSSTVQDHKLGFRMLVEYPGLTLGGLAFAIAIGIGAGWYDFTSDLLRPTLPLPEGDRIVEVEMRNSATSEDEQRLLHDFLIWRRDSGGHAGFDCESLDGRRGAAVLRVVRYSDRGRPRLPRW